VADSRRDGDFPGEAEGDQKLETSSIRQAYFFIVDALGRTHAMKTTQSIDQRQNA